jgi:predicted AAA+ superfamily ATPase
MCNIDDVLKVYRSNISSAEEVYYFFDEIQYADNWNTWLKILYDTNPYISIMATGSASPMLTDKAKESGLGRWVTIQVPTLSFYEYCKLIGVEDIDVPINVKPTQLYLLDETKQIEIMKKMEHLQPHFIRYLQVGGFPELAISKDDIYFH